MSLSCLKCNNNESFTVLLQMRTDGGINTYPQMLEESRDMLINTLICEKCGCYMHYNADGELVESFKDLKRKEVSDLEIVSRLKKLGHSELSELLKTLTKEE